MRHEPTVCPSPQARIKAIYVFPPHSVSVFFIWLWWAGKAKILASNMPCVESSESSPLDRQGSPSLVFLLQVARTFRALYILGITQSFLVLLFPSPPPLLSNFRTLALGKTPPLLILDYLPLLPQAPTLTISLCVLG